MNWESLINRLEQVEGRRILVLGDYMLDHYLYGDAERISPEAPVPVLRMQREESALGGAGSVAANVAALGATPICIGVIGMGVDGETLAKLLEEAGADTSGLVRSATRRTTRKTRIVGLAQHRHRQQLMRFDDESREPLDDKTAKLVIGELKRHVGSCDAICIEDYNKGVVTNKIASTLIQMGRDANVPVLVDPAPLDEYDKYAGASLITPNRTETERLIRRRLTGIEDVEKHKVDILKSAKTQRVCVTLDADGAALIGRDGYFAHIPTRKRDVYDVTGAGDEVLAALAVGIALGCCDEDAIALANIAGGLEVEKFGCVPISRDEVIGEILLEHHQALGKVRTLDKLLPELKRRRSAKEKVAFTNGCYDLLHAGHAATFAYCKQHADILVVGVNSDDSVRRLGKGDGRPYVGETDRADLLAALGDVDYVVVFDDDTPTGLIEAIKPEYLAKGSEYEKAGVVGHEIVESYGGEILLVPMRVGLSTSELAQRIQAADARNLAHADKADR